MVIPNLFVKLDYNPTHDILHVQWPDMHEHTLPELNYIIKEIVETVKNYHIRRILADSRNAFITLDKDVYATTINQLAISLAGTRLEKFARLVTPDPNREAIAHNAAALVHGIIAYNSFDNTDEAIAWLIE